MSRTVPVEGGTCAFADSGPVSHDGPPLMFLHGFLGNSGGWSDVVAALEGGYRVLCLDLPGHGRTDVGEEVSRYGADAIVAAIESVLDAAAVERVVLCGYSMGGRAALYFALQRPARVAALLTESASAGIADDGERQRRRHEDEMRARQLEAGGLDAFVDAWESLELFASQRDLPVHVRARVRAERTSGSARALALSLRGFGAGAQPWLGGRLPELSCPAVFMAGSLDGKFSRIAREMAASADGAVVSIVEGAGHNVHIEDPRAFVRRLETLISAAPSAGSAVSRGVG